MAYLKPNPFVAKVFNRVAMATGMGGAETLSVTGRVSGRPQQIPVIPVEVDGSLYVVSPRGDTQWVRNVRALPEATLESRRSRFRYTTTEIFEHERTTVIAAYRRKAGRAVAGYWKQLPDDEDHPTFRLTASSD
jgi:deazaflavin-dependent oxidoreductase (nitroreductase family)